MIVEVIVASALICFNGGCWPALVGPATPRGEYELRLYRIADPRYGGTVMEFKREGGSAFSVHRTWPGRERLYSAPADKRTVTNGCVNLEPDVYAALVECCNGVRIVLR